MMDYINGILTVYWKNYKVRCRRYILTAVELLFPILWFLLLFIQKDSLNYVPRFQLEEFNVRNTDPMLLEEFKMPKHIFYYPQSNFTDSLMTLVKDDLSLMKQKQGEPEKTPVILGVTTDFYQTLLNKLAEDYAAVTFENATNTEWPTRLNYTIHMKKQFRQFSPDFDEIGPHENYGTVYRDFMRLQWEIDTSYIKLISGKDVKQRVSMQEFPFVYLPTNDNATIICNVAYALCCLVLLLPFVSAVSRLVEERVSGVRDMILLTGVSQGQVWLAHYLDALPVGLVYSAAAPAFLCSTAAPLLRHAQPAALAAVLLLHYHAVLVAAFLTAACIFSGQHVTSIATYVYALMSMPLMLLPASTPQYVKYLFMAALPGAPIRDYWSTVAAAERGDENTDSLSVTGTMVFLMLQIVAMPLAYYLPRELYRLHVTRSRRSRSALMKVEHELSEESVETGLEPPQPELFEESDHKRKGIEVVNVDKVFNKQYALRNVSLHVYQGEITVLLGHNGAGKTTLMSIITGVLAPTKGRVFINGVDADEFRLRLRSEIGMCPQKNTFIQHLTVLQHVVFFTMLRRKPLKHAYSQAAALLEQLGLGDKAGCLPQQLSGGMRRRLQLACALAGDASVLLLDEPTSGLDVETRRDLWNLLLAVRGSRTVLLSTHFMEEADALGDRVAALHRGCLRAAATTMHLKRAMGTGYRLSLTTIGNPKENEISSVVTSHVPDATVKGQTFNSLTYNLPSKYSTRFPKLFDDLENNRSNLGIDNIGVGVSTLEEVFLKLCSDSDVKLSDDELDAHEEEPSYKLYKGCYLHWRQLSSLVNRQCRFIYYKKFTYVLLNLLMPVLTALLLAYMMNNTPVTRKLRFDLDLGLFSGVRQPRVLYAGDAEGWDRLNQLSAVYVENIGNNDIAEHILKIGRKSRSEYARYLVGIEYNETDAKVLYSTVYPHTAPVGLNLVSRLLAGRLLPAAEPALLAACAPADPSAGQPDVARPKDLLAVYTVCMCLCLAIMVSTINCVSLPIKERLTGARHAYIMAGCPAELYWGAALLAHVDLYVAPMVLCALLVVGAGDADRTFTPMFALMTFLVLIIGMMAFLSLAYLVTFKHNERSTSLLLTAILVVFGMMTPITQMLRDSTNPTIVDHLLSLIELVMPPHAAMTGMARVGGTARLNAYCDLNRARCPALPPPEPRYRAAECCASSSRPYCYFCFESTAPFPKMVILFGQFVFYATLVILSERGVVGRAWERVRNARYAPADDGADVDDMARAESVYVSKAYMLPSKQIQDMMLVGNLHKNYVSLLGKSCNAVRGVSFSVKKGECFGLLGVNGAGKTTTFRMMTNDEVPTRGAIYANGYRLHESPYNYMKSLGYCPQFSGLDTFLPGFSYLYHLLVIRGMSDKDAYKAANYWMRSVGLEQYARRRIHKYSGGCARRLATVAALCGGAPVALLDEPSAGVDVAARRRVWAALRRATARRALVISSHSMEETEALCARIALLARGRVRALGGAAELRAAHAAGHAVLLKLRPRRAHGDVTDTTDHSGQEDLHQLKTAIREEFDCTLKDEHTTMLHYHVNERMSYSRLFRALERLREAFPALLEDYAVAETTLEEVFLALAQESRENQPGLV